MFQAGAPKRDQGRKRATINSEMDRVVNQVSFPVNLQDDITYPAFIYRNIDEINEVIDNHQQQFG